MSTTNQSSSCEPLTQFVRDFAEWIAVLQQSGSRRRGERPDDPGQDVRASDELERFREPAKAIIIWLELCGRDADAAEVDDAMASLRESARHFEAGELAPVVDQRTGEHPSPLDLLIEAASKAVGRLEDLNAEIPRYVWQGFGDA